jgi:hypothetical protein
MTNDVEYDWHDNIESVNHSSGECILSSCDVTCYNVENVRSGDLLTDMDTPGISLLVRLLSSKAAAS